MNIKKIKILLFIVLSLFLLMVNQSKAITLGSSIGLTLGSSNLNTEENYILNVEDNSSNINLGFFYKYNWNIRKFIIGIEFFYGFLNVKTSASDLDLMNFRYRYGANLNFGYDISENFSFYGIIGSGLVKYQAKLNRISYIDEKKTTRFRPLFGFGVGYDLSVSWKLNFEYNIQTLKIKLSDSHNDYKFKNKLENFVFSIIYKF